MSLTPQPDPFLWVNNVNTTLQEDMRGVPQNIAYYDADDGFQLGPNDPRITALLQVPLNLFRPHVVSDFHETTLDPKWTVVTTGSGSTLLGNGVLTFRTGTTNGSGVEATMPNVPMPLVPGTRIYFYLTTLPNGNLDLKFGIKKDANNVIKFSRVEDNTAANYRAKCMAGGVETNASTTAPGDSVRRFFCISMTSAGVNFYVGNDGGQLMLQANIQTNVPSGVGKAYIKFFNRYAVNRDLELDVVYALPIR